MYIWSVRISEPCLLIFPSLHYENFPTLDHNEEVDTQVLWGLLLLYLKILTGVRVMSKWTVLLTPPPPIPNYTSTSNPAPASTYLVNDTLLWIAYFHSWSFHDLPSGLPVTERERVLKVWRWKWMCNKDKEIRMLNHLQQTKCHLTGFSYLLYYDQETIAVLHWAYMSRRTNHTFSCFRDPSVSLCS